MSSIFSGAFGFSTDTASAAYAATLAAPHLDHAATDRGRIEAKIDEEYFTE